MRVTAKAKGTSKQTLAGRVAGQLASPSRHKTRVRLTRSLQDLSTAMADALEDILRVERLAR